MDRDARPLVGWIDHEVPVHLPVTEAFQRPIPQDLTIPMFDEQQIKKDSEKAKYLRDHPPTPDGKAGGLPIKAPKQP
jgi:hypothetical protein